MKAIMAIMLVLIMAYSAFADRYEYRANVNIYIPENDSTGVRDTIFIPDHVLIEDINFYVGVGTNDEPWGEYIIIDVFSPWQARVRLNDRGGERIYVYNIWYDNQRQEDGPGQLEDYAGNDAYGPWEMFCFNPYEDLTMTWYSWRIEVIGTPLSGVSEDRPAVPTDYAITGSYPNPFNGQVMIEYAVPQSSALKLEIFDIAGRKVRGLIAGEVPVGYHQLIWDGANDDGQTVASGVYLVRLAAGERQMTSRVTLLK